jgi:hypothetical protein
LVGELEREALVCEKVLAKLDVEKAKAVRLVARELAEAADAVDAARSGDGPSHLHAECLERLGALAMKGHELLGHACEPLDAPTPAPRHAIRRPSSPRRPAIPRKASQPKVEVARVMLTRAARRPKPE